MQVESATRYFPARIGGESVDAGDRLPIFDPATGRSFAEVARCGKTEIDQAVAAARAAASGWQERNVIERARLLRGLAEVLIRDQNSLALLESTDTGKPLAQASADVAVAARYFEYYAGTVEALFGDTLSSSSNMFLFTLREPLGVTGHIIPWNYPLQIGARTLAPALATGNCCVLKPAEEAPLTALRLGQLATEVGFPSGTLNIVPGYGEEAGAALVDHSGIDHLSFTGSVETGRIVAGKAGKNLVPVTLELGGKSPNIVFADADLDIALPVIATSLVQNAGQTCSAGTRLLVDDRIHGEVVTRLKQIFQGLRLGAGPDDPDLGPLISEKQRQRVQSIVDSAKEDCILVCGGSVPHGDDLDERLEGGFFYLPTILDEVDPDSDLAQTEVFGPVLAVSSFSDVANAVAMANNSQYGLIGAVWTGDLATAHQVIRHLEVGQVFVNTYGAGGGVELPFGGVKRSGYGREKGFEALLSFTQTKSVAMRFG